MKFIQYFLLFSLFTSQAFAGSQTGKVTSILVRQSDGLHYFYMSGVGENKPDCASSHTYWMIKDENSTVGKTQFSMLLTAYASGKTISVIGTNSCTRWGDGEDLNSIALK